MKNFALSTVSYLLITTMFLLTVLLASPSTDAIGQSIQDKDGKNYKSKIARGEVVALRAKELRAKNKGVARAMKNLERRGFRLAMEHSTSFLAETDTETAQSRSSVMRPASFQVQTFSNEGYEMTFIPYDVGNPNIFEAVIYEHNPNMLEYSYEFSMDISGGLATGTVIEESYYPADGSAPLSSYDPLYYDPSYHPYDPKYDGGKRGFYTAKAEPISNRNLHFTKAGFVQQQPPRDRHWQQRAGRWVRCVTGGTLVFAVACLATGPAWLPCFTYGFVGTELGCIILTW